MVWYRKDLITVVGSCPIITGQKTVCIHGILYVKTIIFPCDWKNPSVGSVTAYNSGVAKPCPGWNTFWSFSITVHWGGYDCIPGTNLHGEVAVISSSTDCVVDKWESMR